MTIFCWALCIHRAQFYAGQYTFKPLLHKSWPWRLAQFKPLKAYSLNCFIHFLNSPLIEDGGGTAALAGTMHSEQQWNPKWIFGKVIASKSHPTHSSCRVKMDVDSAAEGEESPPRPPLIYGPTGDHLPPLDPLSGSTSLLQPATCWMLTDGAPRSGKENTHHLLQLLSLTTIFEFDGLSNYIPPPPPHLSPELREATNQAADTAKRLKTVVSSKCLLYKTRKPPFLLNNHLDFLLKKPYSRLAPSCEEILQRIVDQIKVQPHGSVSAQSLGFGVVK